MNKISEETRFKLSTLFLAIAAMALLAGRAGAQDTNACYMPATRLEAVQTNIGRIIINATAPIGSVSAKGGTVTVNCKELTDTSTGQRDYGIAITVAEGQGAVDTALVDYEEIAPLMSALDYLNKIDWSVTSLSSFDAFYVTQGGFRMAVFSSRRTGTVEFAVRTTRLNQSPVLLSRDLVAQLRSLFEQAKSKLDALRAGR